MKEAFEREKRKLSAQKPYDGRQKRRGFNKVQTTALSSAVAALAVLSAKKAKAETSDSAVTSLGTPFSQEINDFIWISLSELYPQLISGVAKNEFIMTITNDWEGYGDVSKVSFQLQDDVSTNGVVIQQIGTITDVPEASNPNYTESSYLEIDSGDGKITKIFTTGGSWIDVGGITKWNSDTCNNYEDFTALHPSGNKGELKIVDNNNYSSLICGDVYRVQLDTNDYCEEKVLDTQESNKAPCIISAPETKDLVAIEAYNKTTEAYPNFFIARKPDGTLLHLKRSTDGTWTKENPQKGTSDFAENVALKAMIDRTTPNDREVTILVITEGYDIKALVLEKQPESTPESPVWKEVPVTMTQDPTIIPEELDSDGDGVKNGVDNCPGAANPDQLDLNADGYGDACASADCKDSGGYPWEKDAQTTTNASGLTVCKSDLVPGFSAYVQSDQSMIHSDKDVVLDSAGNISAQTGQTLVYVHTQKAGTEALPAKKMIFPAGNSIELEIYSTEKLDGSPGTATLNSTDFLGQSVEVKFDGPTNWKSEGVIVGGELGIEGCYYKAIVGDENVIVGCPPVCGAELPLPQPEPEPEPQPEPAVELAQAETVVQAEEPVQAESPPALAEIPMPIAEPPPADIYESPDAKAETAEEAGAVIIPQAEPAPEPASDVSQSLDGQPDVGQDIAPDIAQAPDTVQGFDTLQAPDSENFDTLPPPIDTPEDGELSQDSAPAPETPIQPDSAPESSNSDTAIDNSQYFDSGTPDNNAKTETPLPNSKDAFISGDSTAEKPIPEEKPEKSGGGGGCSLISEPAHYPYLNLKQTIEVNPLSAVVVAAVVARAILMVRKAVQGKI